MKCALTLVSHQQQYPRARLGDFGLAIRTSENDPFNPFAYATDVGTPCWQPFEQYSLNSFGSRLPLKGHKLGEATNVWGIGATIMRLMNRDYYPKEPTYFDETDTFEQQEPLFQNDAQNIYSPHLVKLVRSCVAFAPSRRPTLRDIREEILLRSTPGPDDCAEGMRDGGQPLNEGNTLIFPPEEEEYKIGFGRSKRRKLR